MVPPPGAPHINGPASDGSDTRGFPMLSRYGGGGELNQAVTTIPGLIEAMPREPNRCGRQRGKSRVTRRNDAETSKKKPQKGYRNCLIFSSFRVISNTSFS